MNSIVAALSRLLEPAERECVCGDLEELRISAPAAAVNVLGLVLRRQLGQWSHWGPWIALFGVAGVAGSYLSGSVGQVETGLFMQIRTYLTYGVAYEPGGVGVAQQIAYSATSAGAVLLWSWACGFILKSLSGGALWMTSTLFYCVVRDGWALREALSGHMILKQSLWSTMVLRLLPLDTVTISFVFALVFGVRSATRGGLKQNTRRVVMLAGLVFVILLASMESWFAAGFAHWSGQPYVPTPLLPRVMPLLAAGWPVFAVGLLNSSALETHQKRMA